MKNKMILFNGWFKKLRDDDINSKILNYLAMAYIFSLTVSYKVDGTILWLIVLIFLLNENIGIKIRNAFKNRFVQASVVYFFIFIIWMFGSDNIDTAIYILKYNKPVLYSLLFVAFLRKEFISKFIAVFIVGMIINVVWSYLIFFGYATQPFWSVQSGYLPILYKTDHAFFILVVLGYSLYRLLVVNDPLKYKILFGILFSFESINIFLSGSRTGMITYLIMVGFTLIYVYRKNIYKIVLFFSLLFCFFVSSVYFFLPEVKVNIINEYKGLVKSIEQNDYNSSSGARVGMAKYALQVIGENLWLGVGTGDHISVTLEKMKISENYKDGQKYQEIENVFGAGHSAMLHNNYLQLMVQFGLVGLFSLLFIFMAILRSHFLEDEYRYMAFLIIVLSLVVMGTGYDFGLNNYGKFFIFILSAMIVQNIQNKNTSEYLIHTHK